MSFRSGFISIIGRPNVGKSTLCNQFIGDKISIISEKPQTTRNKIMGILTRDTAQMIFLDTPGIHGTKNKLDVYMQKCVSNALDEVDVILYLIDSTPHIKKADMENINKLASVKTPVFLVINKIDTVEKQLLLGLIDECKKLHNFAEIMLISALNGQNVVELIDCIERYLPEGPLYYPEDMITDQPEKQITAEIIREKALRYLQDELPHGICVEIMSMKSRNDRDLVDVTATIYCEKDSHKGMIIGKNGEKLKKIGSQARAEITALLGSQIYLDIWVKVKEDWRQNEAFLKNIGYNKREI